MVRGHLISLAYALGFGKLCVPTCSALNSRAYRAFPRGQDAHSPLVDERFATHTHEVEVVMEPARIAHLRKHCPFRTTTQNTSFLRKCR